MNIRSRSNQALGAHPTHPSFSATSSSPQGTTFRPLSACAMQLARVAGRQEGVEAENELVVAKEEFEHAVDDVQRVDALRLELLHDVEELPQDARAFRQGSRRVRVRDARTRMSITMAPTCGSGVRRTRQRCAAQAHTLL